VRIGIHAGEPVADHNDLFGTTVQLAHRLCSEAEADGVIISGLVRELSDEDKGRFVALGERRLKGFTERTPVFRFEWRAKCEAELSNGAIVIPRTGCAQS
jgi:class 3 adenylate cyclase